MKKITLTILIILVGTYPVQAGVWWIDGHLEINDGDVYDGELFIIDHGSVDMFGGVVGKLETWDYSTGSIYGGEIDWLWTDDNTIVNIYGGNLNWLASRPDSTVYLYAYDVKYHQTGGLFDNPWLEGKYLLDDNAFSFTLYGDDSMSQVNIITNIVDAMIDLNPDSLNISSKGKWIDCRIRLPEDYNVSDVNSYSILLEDQISADWVWFNEEQNILMVKFNRSEVKEILEPGEVELTVRGSFENGTYFEGTDTIRVIDKGRKEK